MARIGTRSADVETAFAQILDATLRSDLTVRRIPAPDRLAPQSIALAAGIIRGPRRISSEPAADDAEASIDSRHGAGRLVLMHDADRVEEWGAPFRVVCFAEAPLEVEIGTDPFISDVAWSWLVDSLESRGAAYGSLAGTATKTLSSGFGALESEGDGAQIEIRASWTPLGENFSAHAQAWAELLCLLAGLPHSDGS